MTDNRYGLYTTKYDKPLEWRVHHDERNGLGGYYTNRPWCIENFISRHISLIHEAKIQGEGYKKYGGQPNYYMILHFGYSDLVPANWGVNCHDKRYRQPEKVDGVFALIKWDYE